MFTRIVTTALFAGFLTGIAAAILQFWLVQPLLLHAELYEGGELVHFGPGASGVTAHPDLPGFDATRDGLSVLFTAMIYTGYGFILTAALAFASERGITVSAREGVLWGLGGFAALQLAPAIGLPPELPGAAAADVTARQIWWFATAGATAAGLLCLAYGRNVALWIAGGVLIALPHLIGAPEPSSFVGPTPPEIAAHFAARALAVGLAAWAILGFLTAWFWSREA